MSTSQNVKDIVYGAVHDTHDFRYIGFCKKVRSDDIQNVYVWIDGEKVETLRCDKTIDKITTIYDKSGCAFEYNLPEQYMGEKHSVGFTCNGQELENSPMETITKDDDRFNEYRFMHSLGDPIDEEKIRDLHCPNAIGFLATEENLADKEFVGYLLELSRMFSDVQLVGFYFSTTNISILDNQAYVLRECKNVSKILSNSNIFIYNSKTSSNIMDRSLLDFLVNHAENIFIATFFSDRHKVCLRDIHNVNNNLYINKLEASLQIDMHDVDSKNRENFIFLIYNYLLKKHLGIDLKINGNTLYGKIINLSIQNALKSPSYRKYMHKLFQILRNKRIR